jgi:soluble lytic murein transglycosylase-like protein
MRLQKKQAIWLAAMATLSVSVQAHTYRLGGATVTDLTPASVAAAPSAAEHRHALPPRHHALDSAIASAARDSGIDAALVKAVAWTESRFRPDALSPKGAQGVMQLMPGTAAKLAVDKPFDIDQNLQGGARLLRLLLDRYASNVPLALAAYNAGEGAVARFGGQVPPFLETQRYVAAVMAGHSALSGDAAVAPTVLAPVARSSSRPAIETSSATAAAGMALGRGLVIDLPQRAAAPLRRAPSSVLGI